MGPRAGLDGQKISSLPGYDPGPSSPQSFAIRSELPGPQEMQGTGEKCAAMQAFSAEPPTCFATPHTNKLPSQPVHIVTNMIAFRTQQTLNYKCRNSSLIK